MTSQVLLNLFLFNETIDSGTKPKWTRQVPVRIRHLRNRERTKTGKVVFSKTGGHTILTTNDGRMYISTCNFTSDTFCRREGLRQAVQHLLADMFPRNGDRRSNESQYVATVVRGFGPGTMGLSEIDVYLADRDSIPAGKDAEDIAPV